MLLFDTCAIINLSYCPPVATLFRSRYEGRGGWADAVREELRRQRTRKPPHPQAGRAYNWAISWLGNPIRTTDELGQIAISQIQESIAVGSNDDSLDHLGEAASIYLLMVAGTGRLITDDRAARDVARMKGVKAASTVGVLVELLSRNVVSSAEVDDYLDILRSRGRMRVKLTSTGLAAGNLESWS